MTSVPPTEPDPRRWKALSVTLAAGFMSLLDVSIVSVALPSMQQGLHTTPANIQWVVSGYALAFGLALVPAGRLGDAVGRRTMFLWALTAFTVFSALAGAAPSILVLALARFAQGLAAGALAPQNSGLIQQLFTGPERGRAFGFFGSTVGISTAIGPIAGGVIIALAGPEEGWRWIFYVNVPIGAVALILAARLLPKGGSGRREHMDLAGVGLLGAAVLAILLPLVLAESGGVQRFWWLFLVGVAIAYVFVRWERRVVQRGRQPLLNIPLLRTTDGYGTGIALGSVYFVGFSGIWLVFALFFQNGLGFTPLLSGLVVTPFAVGSAVSAVVGGRLVERWGRGLTVTGLTLVLAGLVVTALVIGFAPRDALGWIVPFPMLVAGIGGGWVISPNTTMTLRCVPVAMAGSAGGALQTGQRVGAAIGGAALPGLFYGVLAATGQDFQTSAAVALGAAVVGVLCSYAVALYEWRADRVAALARHDVPEHAPSE